MNLVLIASALLILVVGVAVSTGSVHLQPVLSGSMRPGVQPGDLVVTRRVAVTSLKAGDVIVFFPPGTRGDPKLHRIASITRVVTVAGPVTTITTKGDANNLVDPWGPVTLAGTSSYRMATVVPVVGWVPVWLSHLPGRAGRAALLIAAGLLFALVAIKALRRQPASAPKALTRQPGSAPDSQTDYPGVTQEEDVAA